MGKPKPTVHSRRDTVLGLVILFLVGCSPMWLCGIILVNEAVRDYNFRQGMHIYPGAIRVGRDEQLYCCDSITQIEFYWTNDLRDKVQSHYEQFAIPFLGNRTIFHHLGEVLELELNNIPYITTKEDEDFLETRECHFSQKQTCVQVELTEFANGEPVVIPDLTITMLGADPPTTLENTGGTLITYTYFEEADLNIRFFE